MLCRQFVPIAVVAACLAPAAAEPVAAPGYAPDDACLPCHRDIARTYREVGMAQSFFPPRADLAIEDFDRHNEFHHAPSDRTYTMTQRGDDFFVTRSRRDAQGRRIDVLDQRIDYVIGSGGHSRGYLYRTPSGELFEIPVAWYTQTQSWGMAPGYDHPNHDDFVRPITRTCMFCHNAYPNVPAGSDAFGRPHVFPDDLPHGIGCQRCHGPGAAHVAIANDLDAPLAEVRRSILRVGDLPAARRDDVCYQCHHQPSSKRTSFLRRFGVADYAYRPGTPLDEAMVHFDFVGDEPAAARFEINHHPYRLRQSRCFIASEGAISCLTCHDPHRKVPATEAAAHYGAACRTCHAVDDCDIEAMRAAGATDTLDDTLRRTPATDCVTCHMPKRRTEDVIHVVMTDHLIQRRPDFAAATAPRVETAPDAQAAVVIVGDPVFDDAREEALYGLLSAVNDGDRDAALALRDLVLSFPPDAVEPWVALGTAQLEFRDGHGALASFDAAIARDPTLALAWTDRGIALGLLDRNDDAVASFRRALDLDPDRAETHYNLALVLADDAAAVRAHLERAVALRPNYAIAWLALGNIRAQAGAFDEAIRCFARAIAVDPTLHRARRNLGTALRDAGRVAEAIDVYVEYLRHRPDDAGVRTRLEAMRATNAGEADAPSGAPSHGEF